MVTPEQIALAETATAAAMTTIRPALPAIWRALDQVPDPEIPVVSVVELGIVRSVEWDAADPALLIVRVTPTSPALRCDGPWWTRRHQCPSRRGASKPWSS